MLERAIYELLKTLANGEVSYMRAKQDAKGPYIVIQRVDSARVRSLQGPSKLPSAYLQIDCYDQSYIASKELSYQVETILDGFRGTVYYGGDSPQESVTIGSISLQNDLDLLDETDDPVMYRNSLTFLVMYHQ